MSSYMRAELRNIGRKKRKLEDEEQSESSSSGVEESETTSTQCKEDSAEGKSPFLRSSLSKECKTTSTSEEVDDSTDSSYSEERLTDGKEGVYLASEWQYTDLKNINIFYNEKPDPIDELMQDVKNDILKNYPNYRYPDFENTVAKFCSFTKESLLFSCDFDEIVDSIKKPLLDRLRLENSIIKDIRSDIERAEKVDRDLDLSDWLNRKWFPGVRDFLSSTLSLINTILLPIEEDESVTKMKEPFRRKMRKRKHKEIKDAGRSTLKSVYKHQCEMFGGLFFLGKKGAIRRTMVVGNNVSTSAPDFAYPLASVLQSGRNLENWIQLFIVEVKGTPINNVSSDCLEEQLDSYVLGQVGSELIAQAMTSAMYPNSLGMICMETKLIFVYLKMPQELHNISFPLKTEGKIHYTRPFDMLKAIDRAEVCELMYWLGCIQNRHGSKLCG